MILTLTHIGKTERFSHTHESGDAFYWVKLYDYGPDDSPSGEVLARFLGCSSEVLPPDAWVVVYQIDRKYFVKTPTFAGKQEILI